MMNEEDEAFETVLRQSEWRKRQIADMQQKHEREALIKQTAKKCAEIADLAEPYKSADLILKHFGVDETDDEATEAIRIGQEALAQPPEEHNFCPRCGKRRRGKNDWDVHTCSPPQPEIECPDCKQQRKPLTRERLLEIADAQCGAQRTFEDWVELFGRCIEAAHGITGEST